MEPLIELGTEMIRRGHEFRVAALEKFRPLAEQRQVPFIHLDGDADYFMKLMVTDYRKSTDFVNGYRAFYESVPGIFDQIADAVKGQDAAFYGTCSFFVRSACDYHHVTCIRYFFSPFDRTNQYSLYTDKHNSPMVGLTYLSAEPAPLYIRKRICSEEELEAALRDLVSGKYDAGAKRVSEKLLLEDGCREAADILEKIYG